ncbi:MAG TPA: tetraacyldisaccharide 4'-kinase [Gemmatimonadales bacterium]|jgi:tetraacyldisaccharide 4'-kinase|nr:tetraacyldisaccharide 4'-kinase [Gemmatimonadales bacterium]
MGRRGDTHRLIRWLWTSRRLDAQLARLALLPLAALWRVGMSVRNLAFDRGWLAVRALPLPAVAVGNLSVGGSGKTPIASWIAAYYASRGLVPGVLLSGYGRDEVLVHRQRVPTARVVADPDRVRAGVQAAAEGAVVLVLDDAFQLRQVRSDYNIAVVSAETSRAVRWPLPAGPWREGLSALARADALIITRKRAAATVAAELAGRLAARVQGPTGVVHLGVRRYEGLLTARATPAETLAGSRVVAAAAIADPDAFIAQTKATGAQVQVATWRDHHEFRDEDVAWLAKAARKADHLVITQKDAVKLRDRWPASVPEPLVAVLDVEWEAGEAEFRAALNAIVTPVERL